MLSPTDGMGCRTVNSIRTSVMASAETVMLRAETLLMQAASKYFVSGM